MADLLVGERRLLNDFYERQAYLRDPEHLDIARKLLNGLEMLQFRLVNYVSSCPYSTI